MLSENDKKKQPDFVRKFKLYLVIGILTLNKHNDG